jgi:nitrite reductase (NO-forming)
VQVTLVDGDGAQHDVAFPDFNAKSDLVTGQGSSSTFVFRADQEGSFSYYCTVPGHRQAGMEGVIEVGATQQVAETLPSVVRDPSDVPAPLGQREPTTLNVTLETKEVTARLADGTSYRFWTFEGQVPGPLVRVRIGDTVNVTLKNAPDSTMIHSVDFHAVTGPGGGAVATQTQPGSETSFSFQALNPGLYVYHCATPMVAHHIANGMYGLILVEPEGGLPEVDHEFYIMQGEVYTQEAFGQHGEAQLSVEKLLNEDPEYFVFNGAVGGLTTEKPMHAKVGETVRIFFGVGGPNFTSSFHVIGEIFDRVYEQASLTSSPLTDVQTTTVPPGGATMVEFKLQVPGRYMLVDHALSRLERGLVGFLFAEGEENLAVFHGAVTPGSGH